MDLSIIIVNWNTKDELAGCLDSVASQLQGTKAETFVVDNGSGDGSPEIIRLQYPWVCLLENRENLGFSRAVNLALTKATGRYLLLLNPDTRIKQGSIATMISFMEGCPDAGAAGAQLLNPDGSKQNSIANFPSLATELFNKSILRWLFPKRFPGKERIYPEAIEVDSVIGASMIVRREVAEQVGLLDEDYFLFLEETDWCYRIKRGGWKIYHVPQAGVYHFQGKSVEREKRKAKVEYYRSRYHFFKKNRGAFLWLILHIGLVTRLAVELVLTTGACFFTLFTIRKWREKLFLSAYLLLWHIRLCPGGMGLRTAR